MRTHGLLALGVLLLAATGAACRGTSDDAASALDVRLRTAPTPPVVGPTRVVITLMDPEGRPLQDARVHLEGTMTHAGMGVVRERAEHEAEGRYVVDDFTFTMAGDWVLTARVQLPDGTETSRDLQVRVSGETAPPSSSAESSRP